MKIVFDCDGTLLRSSPEGPIIYTGIRELLEQLKNDGHELYVWTGRDRGSTIEYLKSLDIISFFIDFSCADDGLSKPHPDGPTKMLGGEDKENIILIGDSLNDLHGAKNYGISFIFVDWESRLKDHYERLKSDGVEAIFRTPQELYQHIIKIDK
ncbi:MAG: HAD family hydrolase [Bacteriovoracaceae bacterium]